MPTATRSIGTITEDAKTVEFCAVVRETLCELEIPYVLQPCARGSTRRTSLARRAEGAFQVPYLEDPNTGVAMFESADIVEYLRSSYQVSPPFER